MGSFSELTELQNFFHLVFVSLFSFWYISFCNLLMDYLVDGRFCLACCRLSLRFSLISFKVSLFIFTLSAFSRQSTLGIGVGGFFHGVNQMFLVFIHVRSFRGK